jgi:hypothetical protein
MKRALGCLFVLAAGLSPGCSTSPGSGDSSGDGDGIPPVSEGCEIMEFSPVAPDEMVYEGESAEALSSRLSGEFQFTGVYFSSSAQDSTDVTLRLNPVGVHRLELRRSSEGLSVTCNSGFVVEVGLEITTEDGHLRESIERFFIILDGPLFGSGVYELPAEEVRGSILSRHEALDGIPREPSSMLIRFDIARTRPGAPFAIEGGTQLVGGGLVGGTGLASLGFR